MKFQIGTYGHVTSYNQNSIGQYECTLYYDNTSTLINCLGILNTYNLVSPKDPNQMLIMSDDNKYVFLPTGSTITYSQTQLLTYYLICFTFVNNNNFKIPLTTSIIKLNDYVTSIAYKPTDDVYNSITNQVLKYQYGMYLAGLYPPASLSSVSASLLDVSLYYNSLYQYGKSSISFDPSYNPVNPTYVNKNTILPNNLCVVLDTQKVLPIAVNIDCRSVPQSIPNGIYVVSNNPDLVALGSATPSLYSISNIPVSSLTGSSLTGSSLTGSRLAGSGSSGSSGPSESLGLFGSIGSKFNLGSFDTRINIYLSLIFILAIISIYIK